MADEHKFDPASSHTEGFPCYIRLLSSLQHRFIELYRSLILEFYFFSASITL